MSRIRSIGRRGQRWLERGRMVHVSVILDYAKNTQSVPVTYVKPRSGPRYDDNGMLVNAPNDGGVRR